MNVLVFHSTRAPKSQWVIICEIGDVGNFGNLSGSFVTFSSLICPFIYPFTVCFVQDTVRHCTSVTEWFVCTLKLHWSQHQCNRMVLGTLYYDWTGSFTVLEHKTKYLFACQNVLFIFSKVHSQMFIQLHKCQCYSSYK